jgi:hypothetical protein
MSRSCSLCKDLDRNKPHFYKNEMITVYEVDGDYLVVSNKHRPYFTVREKNNIEYVKRVIKIDYNVDWDMKDNPSHAHCWIRKIK